MEKRLRQSVASIVKDLYGLEIDPVLTRPEEQFGDYSTNIAMQLAAKLSVGSPREIAEQIVSKLDFDAAVAGPGFINISLPDQELFMASQTATSLNKSLAGQVIVAEYSDPNPFKVLHAGHLYTTLVGDAIANTLETAGAALHRVNFGGDVGLHVGKAMWGILQKLGGENPAGLRNVPANERAEWISDRYVEGNKAYESDETAKTQINEINKRIYRLHEEQDKQSPLVQIYWTCRQWSYDGFDKLYEELQVHSFDKYYPESAVSDLGVETVKKHLGQVYEESDGAVVFRGEPYGLFTQVFLNSEGLPTYAGKDVGLIQQKYNDYHYDVSFIITDVSQKDHLAVVMKSIEQYEPELVKKTVHRTHGRIKLEGGQKMSSRSGAVVLASDIIESAAATAKQIAKHEDKDIVLGAVRYSFLKTRIGGDIVYDPKESVSVEGNSGPYLQYALVRARSILQKVQSSKFKVQNVEGLDSFERSLARKISMYSEAFEAALFDYSPHHIANYLYELAVVFNRFYENSRVAGDPREAIRLELVSSYEKVLVHGLGILGMPMPKKM